ncbi:MAG: GTP-binding protein [Clostridia bacterium]|nr:GTP-binding protein [Clostridia bacterium]
METTKKITKDALCKSLSALADEKRYGTILRAKGIVPSSKDTWLHFDYIPGALDVREGAADIIGRICVIGAELHEDAIRALFELDA